VSIRIASSSVEPIEGIVPTDVDPSSSDVKAMYLATGTDAPATSDNGWVTGAWKTPESVLGGTRYRTPAWFTVQGLDPGVYDVWIWVDGATYDPILPAASLEITP
jgi:hypothetical protein